MIKRFYHQNAFMVKLDLSLSAAAVLIKEGKPRQFVLFIYFLSVNLRRKGVFAFAINQREFSLSSNLFA